MRQNKPYVVTTPLPTCTEGHVQYHDKPCNRMRSPKQVAGELSHTANLRPQLIICLATYNDQRNVVLRACKNIFIAPCTVERTFAVDRTIQCNSSPQGLLSKDVTQGSSRSHHTVQVRPLGSLCLHPGDTTKALSLQRLQSVHSADGWIKYRLSAEKDTKQKTQWIRR